jgi:UDP-N-acetylglucosamine 4,6-dehydratase
MATETTRSCESLTNRVVVITGGTGSFGHTMARYALEHGCRELRIVSRDEAKQDTMRSEMTDKAVRFYIGDVRDASSLDAPFEGAELIFHAAALKQVPSCEFFPMQAVMTNVNGSENVLKAAELHRVKSVVCLSTDKAVYPINAMGMSKAMMEKVVQAWARGHPHSETTISVVRYGNVMHSRGSVIPLFIKCIQEGRPLPVTESAMTRFMMPLSQAVELVEFAMLRANSGDLFVHRAPACTVGDLASALLDLFHSSSEVNTIGFRHGEKLYETLATKEELRRAENLGEYFRVPMDDRDLNYSAFFEEGDPLEAETEDFHSHNAVRLAPNELRRMLCSLPQIRGALERSIGSEGLLETLQSLELS